MSLPYLPGTLLIPVFFLHSWHSLTLPSSPTERVAMWGAGQWHTLHRPGLGRGLVWLWRGGEVSCGHYRTRVQSHLRTHRNECPRTSLNTHTHIYMNTNKTLLDKIRYTASMCFWLDIIFGWFKTQANNNNNKNNVIIDVLGNLIFHHN